MDKIKKQLNEGDVVIQKHPFGVNKMPNQYVPKYANGKEKSVLASL